MGAAGGFALEPGAPPIPAAAFLAALAAAAGREVADRAGMGEK